MFSTHSQDKFKIVLFDINIFWTFSDRNLGERIKREKYTYSCANFLLASNVYFVKINLSKLLIYLLVLGSEKTKIIYLPILLLLLCCLHRQQHMEWLVFLKRNHSQSFYLRWMRSLHYYFLFVFFIFVVIIPSPSCHAAI